MNRRTFIWILIVFFSATNTGISKGKKYRFAKIEIKNDQLVFSFEMRDLMDKTILNSLQKGMTAALEYQVQLWKVRPGWVDQLVEEKNIRIKVSYDKWERKYVAIAGEGEPRLFNEDNIRKRCEHMLNFPVVPLNRLEPDSRYLIAVKVILQPMSVENYQEIKRWLTGEVNALHPDDLQPNSKTGRKAGNWLLGLVLNLTGFGDRVVAGKSDAFLFNNGTILTE